MTTPAPLRILSIPERHAASEELKAAIKSPIAVLKRHEADLRLRKRAHSAACEEAIAMTLTTTNMSQFQAQIMGVLPAPDETPIPPSELFRRLGIERPTKVQRAILSRSIARLAVRKLIVRRYPVQSIRGRGCLVNKCAPKSRQDNQSRG